MPSITIKNIPEALYGHLKQAANAHHRSINSELIVCLEKALLPNKRSPAELLEKAKMLRESVATYTITAEEIDAAKHEGRP